MQKRLVELCAKKLFFQFILTMYTNYKHLYQKTIKTYTNVNLLSNPNVNLQNGVAH